MHHVPADFPDRPAVRKIDSAATNDPLLVKQDIIEFPLAFQIGVQIGRLLRREISGRIQPKQLHHSLLVGRFVFPDYNLPVHYSINYFRPTADTPHKDSQSPGIRGLHRPENPSSEACLRPRSGTAAGRSVPQADAAGKPAKKKRKEVCLFRIESLPLPKRSGHRPSGAGNGLAGTYAPNSKNPKKFIPRSGRSTRQKPEIQKRHTLLWEKSS